MTKLVPTAEQQACVAMIAENKQLKIVAGAGCSKTTTLSMVAHATQCKSLYLAFNKAMVEEAKNKFPAWVTVKTTHGLAYSVFGSQIQHKLKRPAGRYVNVCGTGSEIARHYRIGPMHFASGANITASGVGIAVKETVNRFEYSSALEITSEHVSYSPAIRLLKDSTFSKAEYDAIVVGYARLLWKERKDPKSQILATHDTYLKLYQMSNPNLDQYEVIYLDEAQDTNDCVLDIIQKVKSKLVFVGDPRQQIYGWRGSVNAMAKFQCAEATLSTSFRFGQAIADIANVVLSSTAPSKLQLKGWDKLNSIAYRYLPEEQQHTRLYRTNAALILDAVDFLSKGKSVCLEIDVRDFIKLVQSTIALYNDDLPNVKHDLIVPFDDWSSLTEEATHVGGELQRVVRMVTDGTAMRALRVLGDYQKPANPDITMTTAHKSKGREWRVVVLADDFPSCYNSEGEWVGLTEMEENLLYVALTRAREVLVYNDTVYEIMKKNKESSSGSKIGNIQIFDGESFIARENQLEDVLLGEMARQGVITNRHEVAEAIVMARHEAKYLTGLQYEELGREG